MSSNTTDTPGYAPFDLFPYNPSQPPAYAFLGVFGVAGILHLAAMVPYRSFFPLPMIVGCGSEYLFFPCVHLQHGIEADWSPLPINQVEAAAYYFRSRSHDDIRRTLPFIIQNLLLLSAPPFLAATIYMSPRRIARVLEAEHLTVGRRWTTKIFIVVDVACFATQVAGSIMSGSENANEAINGRATILAGLVLQIIAFGLFAVCAVTFHARMFSASTALATSRMLSWQKYTYGLYVVSLLFVIRNIVRIVEYQQGSDGELLSNEVWLYVMDGAVMLAIVVIMLILHPGRLRWKARRQGSIGSQEECIALK